jgi:hypothetical protein
VSDLPPGVYQHLITRELDSLLRTVSDRDLIDRRSLDIADSHEALARHLAALTRRAQAIAEEGLNFERQRYTAH